MSTNNSSPEVGQSVDLDGIRTNFHDQGSGAPVLLIHGSGPGVSAWANWRLVLPTLSERFRVIAPDMAGFGYTVTPASWAASPASWVNQLVKLLERLGIPKVSVIGNSFGGAIALHLANQHPDKVSKLVLMGAVGVSFPITEGLEKVWGYEPSEDAMRDLMKIFAYDHSIINDDLVALRYKASIREDVQQRFASLFPSPRQRWVDMLALEENQLSQISCPTLVVHGVQDQVIPYEASVRLSNILPNAVLHPVDRCGHWVQIEHTAEFLTVVNSFLSTSS